MSYDTFFMVASQFSTIVWGLLIQGWHYLKFCVFHYLKPCCQVLKFCVFHDISWSEILAEKNQTFARGSEISELTVSETESGPTVMFQNNKLLSSSDPHQLRFYLTYILTLYLAFCLTYILTFYRAFFLAYILTFHQSFYLAFYLPSLLTFYLTCCLTFYLTFYLTF